MLIGVLMSQPVNSRCSVFFSNSIFMIAQTTWPVVVRQYVISGRKHYHYIYGKGEYWNTNNYHHHIPRYWDICKYIDIKELQIMKIGVFRYVLVCLPKYMLLLAVVNCCLDGPRCRCMKNGGPGPLGPWNIDPMYVIYIHGCVFYCETYILRRSQFCALLVTNRTVSLVCALYDNKSARHWLPRVKNPHKNSLEWHW